MKTTFSKRLALILALSTLFAILTSCSEGDGRTPMGGGTTESTTASAATGEDTAESASETENDETAESAPETENDETAEEISIPYVFDSSIHSFQTGITNITHITMYSPITELIVPSVIDGARVRSCMWYGIGRSLMEDYPVELPENLPAMMTAEHFEKRLIASLRDSYQIMKVKTFYACLDLSDFPDESATKEQLSFDFPIAVYSPIYILDSKLSDRECETLSGILNQAGYDKACCQEAADELLAIAAEHHTVPIRPTYDGSNVESMILEDGITQVGGFSLFRNLKTISLPASITAINDDSFAELDQLETVHYAGTRSQWYAISIISYEDIGCFVTSVDVTVKCTDGDIIIKATVAEESTN